MLKSKKRKLKKIESELQKLKAKFPDVDFMNREVKYAYDRHEKLIKDSIYLSVDIKFCQSINRKETCSDCSCWKVIVQNL